MVSAPPPPPPPPPVIPEEELLGTDDEDETYEWIKCEDHVPEIAWIRCDTEHEARQRGWDPHMLYFYVFEHGSERGLEECCTTT